MSARAAARVALIHATRLSMAPIDAAFAARWPEAQCFHLLEESLAADRVHRPAGAASLEERFVALSRYAAMAGANGILYTCSAFGAEIEAARRAVQLPTLKPNEAMLDAALAIGARIGLVATFEPSLASIGDELHAAAVARGTVIEIASLFVPDAMAALRRGDVAAHDGAIADAVAQLHGLDVVLLAQFSMARARAAVEGAVNVPVLTSPESAVDALRHAMSSLTTNSSSAVAVAGPPSPRNPP